MSFSELYRKYDELANKYKELVSAARKVMDLSYEMEEENRKLRAKVVSLEITLEIYKGMMKKNETPYTRES